MIAIDVKDDLCSASAFKDVDLVLSPWSSKLQSSTHELCFEYDSSMAASRRSSSPGPSS